MLTVGFSETQVSVHFEEGLPTSEIWGRIQGLANSHIVMWYIGPNGLKEGSRDFYKYHFLSRLRDNMKIRAWLYDLTAWSAFKNSKSKITASSSKAKEIKELSVTAIRCIRSNKIFSAMSNVQGDFLDEFRSRLSQRKFLYTPSEHFENSNIKLGQVFNKQCGLLQDYYEMDAEKTYSIVQYTETFFIIAKIIKSIEDSNSDVNITFALPNDESKYYKDGESSFQKDLVFFLNKSGLLEQRTQRIFVQFLCFNYGEDIMHRPYNAPGKVIKSIDNIDDIM